MTKTRWKGYALPQYTAAVSLTQSSILWNTSICFLRRRIFTSTAPYERQDYRSVLHGCNGADVRDGLLRIRPARRSKNGSGIMIRKIWANVYCMTAACWRTYNTFRTSPYRNYGARSNLSIPFWDWIKPESPRKCPASVLRGLVLWGFKTVMLQ